MTTLYDVTLDLAQTIMQVRQGTATGGSTTTVVDTAIDEPSTYFGTTSRYGTLWLETTNVNDVSKSISGYTFSASPTITFTPAQSSTSAPAAGTVYYAAPPDFPRFVLIQSVNMALQEIGPFPTVDESVTAVIDQQEYDSDDNALFEYNIVRIEMANDTSAPYNWTPHYNWDIKELTKRAVVFDEGYVPTDAYKMRITYLADHAALTTDLCRRGQSHGGPQPRRVGGCQVRLPVEDDPHQGRRGILQTRCSSTPR